MKQLTPLHLDILVHFHSSNEPHPNCNATAVKDYINELVKDCILTPSKDSLSYFVTGMGEAFLKMLLQTPYPTQAWVDANGKVI